MAEINASRGANCISLKNERYGVSVLREYPEDGRLDNPYLYGMPILFPVNRIEGGSFEFEGRRYVFPINEEKTNCHLHGFLHQTPFEIIDRDDSFAKFRYIASNGEYLGFPHAFEIVQSYELKNDGLYHTLEIKNLSDENMPVFLGFHTTFNILFAKGSTPDKIFACAEISEEYERNNELNFLPTGVKPPFDKISQALLSGSFKPFYTRISRHYRGNGKMTLTDTLNRLRMVYENDEKYGFRLIYNGADEGYICLEPQTCLANCQNSPFSRKESGFDFIEPKRTKTYRSKIYLERI